MDTLSYWERVGRNRVSRRAALRGAGIGAAGLAGAALIGCGAEDDDDGATPPPGGATPVVTPDDTPDDEIARGGTLRQGATGVIAGTDPHNSVYHGAGIVRQAYLTLFRNEMLRPDLGLIPELAESHEVSDEVTWTFNLRDNAVIHPNDRGVPERPMDAEDVVASFDRISDPANAGNGFPFFSQWVESYDAPDAQTVRLVTNRPYGWVESALGDSLVSAIVPREFLDMGNEALRETAIGAGPFMVESVTEGQDFRMARNPAFFDESLPYLDNFRRVIFADQASYRTAFATRQVDLFATADYEEAQELTRQVDGVEHVEHGSTGYNSFWMRTDVEPWSDERVRRAMNLAMNRDQYIAIIGKGRGEPMGPLAPVFGEYALSQEELEQLQPFDPQEAADLFQAAGVTQISFVHPTSATMPDYVNILVQQLENIGLQVRPEPLDAGTWVAGYFGSQHEASFSLNQSYKTPDQALLWYRTGGITGGGQYATGLYSEALDEVIDDAASTMDPDERVEAYHEAQRAIFETDPAFLNVFNVTGNTVFYDDVKGLSPGPGNMDEVVFRRTWIDS